MRIAFLGDSVTEGCFEIYAVQDQPGALDTYRDPTAVYHTLLKAKLERLTGEQVEIVNAGISGDNAPGGAKRVRGDVIAREPDLAVVSFGLNDVGGDKDAFITALGDIFMSLRGASVPFIYMTPNMMNTYVHPHTLPVALKIAANTAEYQNSGRMDSYMDAAMETALEHGGGVCDVYSEWKRMARYGVDTTMLLANLINHPIRQMHALFADKLCDIIANR